MVFLKEFFEKVDSEKISRGQKSMQNYPLGKELMFDAPLIGLFNLKLLFLTPTYPLYKDSKLSRQQFRRFFSLQQ